MTQDTQRQSAKIYQFPAGGRASLTPVRETTKRGEATAITSIRPAKIVYGSGWYHEEAVLDDVEEAGNR